MLWPAGTTAGLCHKCIHYQANAAAVHMMLKAVPGATTLLLSSEAAWSLRFLYICRVGLLCIMLHIISRVVQQTGP